MCSTPQTPYIANTHFPYFPSRAATVASHHNARTTLHNTHDVDARTVGQAFHTVTTVVTAVFAIAAIAAVIVVCRPDASAT